MATKVKHLTDGPDGERFYPYTHIDAVVTRSGKDLGSVVSNLESGYSLAGVVTSANFNPGTPDHNVCLIVAASGTLTHFIGADSLPLEITRPKEVAFVGYNVNEGYWKFLAEVSSAFSDFG